MPVTLMNGQECNPCLIENGELVMFDFDYVYEYNNQTSTHHYKYKQFGPRKNDHRK